MSSRSCWTNIRVLYADTDKMGQAYYGSYMKWFEAARSEWIRSQGKSYREMEEDGYFLPVIEAYCSYKKPVFYDDIIKILTTFSFPSPARLKFHYKIFKDSNEDMELVAEGYTVHVCVNRNRKPVKPPDFLKKFSDSEKRG